jgi:hypothetical protein
VTGTLLAPLLPPRHLADERIERDKGVVLLGSSNARKWQEISINVPIRLDDCRSRKVRAIPSATGRYSRAIPMRV